MWTVSNHPANASSGDNRATTTVTKPVKKTMSCENAKRSGALRCNCHQPRAYRVPKIADGISTHGFKSQELNTASDNVSMQALSSQPGVSQLKTGSSRAQQPERTQGQHYRGGEHERATNDMRDSYPDHRIQRLRIKRRSEPSKVRGQAKQ